jgi:hypothetical protein
MVDSSIWMHELILISPLFSQIQGSKVPEISSNTSSLASRRRRSFSCLDSGVFDQLTFHGPAIAEAQCAVSGQFDTVHLAW